MSGAGRFGECRLLRGGMPQPYGHFFQGAHKKRRKKALRSSEPKGFTVCPTFLGSLTFSQED